MIETITRPICFFSLKDNVIYDHFIKQLFYNDSCLKYYDKTYAIGYSNIKYKI